VNELNKPLTHIDYLRRWYGWLDLNKVSRWVLDFQARPEAHPRFFGAEAADSPEDVESMVFETSDVLCSLPAGTERTGGDPGAVGGPNPSVHSREFGTDWTPRVDAAAAAMSPQQLRHVQAACAFAAYYHMDEAYMPLRTMLSGHPNFLADAKAVPAIMAFLFPHHPAARDMADHFEKAIELNLRYHVRPAVPAWAARGGRWTENLGGYFWAWAGSTVRASFLLHHYVDGRNRILQPNISLVARWAMESLTAPLAAAGGKRTHPPQGAHARRRPPPYVLRVLAGELMHYDPLTAEHLLYVTSQDDENLPARDADPWRKMLDETGDNAGTRPELTSTKYTGYGFVLRAAVGTSQEISVHLQQIDAGPNYRWGRAGRGGNGIIYYCAAGRSYSDNGPEDVGDGPRGDVERCTNFGVKKGGGYDRVEGHRRLGKNELTHFGALNTTYYRCIGPYRCVGMNELTEPLYDFGFAQFAQVNAGPDAAPQYRSRSVLMSGAEYIVVYDDVMDEQVEGRFSWFTGREDPFPHIHQLKPGAEGVDAALTRDDDGWHPDPAVLPTRGRYYDGRGSFLTVVTHLDTVSARATNYGCVVDRPGGTDMVFRASELLDHDDDQGAAFRGTAGIIRRSEDSGRWEAALFRGTRIAVPGLSAEIEGCGAGLSLATCGDGFAGLIHAPEGATVRLSGQGRERAFALYLDGQPARTRDHGSVVQFDVPRGTHRWQWNEAPPSPGRPRVLRTINRSGGFTAFWKEVTAAVSYDLEVSRDGGGNWEKLLTGLAATSADVTGLSDGTKVHIRVVANGAAEPGPPSADYPVYVTAERPHWPEGLRAGRDDSAVRLTWGEVLGAREYRLYRRRQGDTDFGLVYSGPRREYVDEDVDPGGVYEYRVSSADDNGEGEPGPITDTDPARLINWDPYPGEGFRRDTESFELGYPELDHYTEERAAILSYPGEENR